MNMRDEKGKAMQILKNIITAILIILRDNRGEVSPRFENVGGVLYYNEDKTRYRITEHFAESGKPITELIKSAIEFECNENNSTKM